MSTKQLFNKLENAPPAVIEWADENKSIRMGGARSIYIPSVEDVANAIRRIPKGQTLTIDQLRKDLAKEYHTDTACPAKTIKYWKWLANLDEELKEQYSNYNIPWWRVLKDGKPSRHMPGGVQHQVMMLKSEGVDLAGT